MMSLLLKTAIAPCSVIGVSVSVKAVWPLVPPVIEPDPLPPKTNFFVVSVSAVVEVVETGMVDEVVCSELVDVGIMLVVVDAAGAELVAGEVVGVELADEVVGSVLVAVEVVEVTLIVVTPVFPTLQISSLEKSLSLL